MENKDIATFLDSMIGNIEQSNIDMFKSILETNEIPNIQNHEDFYYAVVYPFDKFLNAFIKTKIADNNDVVFIMKNLRYIGSNFAKIIVQKEGLSCNTDKSRTIVSSLLNWFKKNQEIDFDYNQEYTYHLPKIVFNRHNEIIEFYEALKALRYGNKEKYLEVIKKYE